MRAARERLLIGSASGDSGSASGPPAPTAIWSLMSDSFLRGSSPRSLVGLSDVSRRSSFRGLCLGVRLIAHADWLRSGPELAAVRLRPRALLTVPRLNLISVCQITSRGTCQVGSYNLPLHLVQVHLPSSEGRRRSPRACRSECQILSILRAGEQPAAPLFLRGPQLRSPTPTGTRPRRPTRTRRPTPNITSKPITRRSL